jgi:formylglycine-generating enzyme required for sulfatase activity
MKNTLKKIGFAAIIAVIGLAALLMTGCPPDDDDNGGGGGGGVTGGGSSATVSIEMVSITGGTFTMGSPSTESGSYSDERPQHSVTLTGFYMGKYQVTQEQYQAVMGTNPSYFSSNPQEGEIQGKRPVENVTWYDAVEFCNKLSAQESLQSVYTISGRTPASGYPITSATVTADFTKNGYRLPTEAQWEYACRAGTITAYNTGDTISDNTGWYSSNSGSKTHEVGKKPANAFGLYDMHGNVWEWCWDWYGDYSSDTQTNPMGASSGTDRVERGGSWYYSAEGLRSAIRRVSNPNNRSYNLGFRLARP